ncbi:MAG: aldo/keto reductase [Dehalococcoidales bacterium]|nr:aldo/keto reductase [Dehalococcoidales bacterium]
MQYRTFPGLDWKPSALGFGAMRLPVIDRDPSRVDIPEATRMIRYAIDHGVNYLDTAYFYHGGNAEQAVAQALKDGYREKIKLATKFPAWEVTSRADFDGAFERQLARLQTDKIDFYLLHGLHRPAWENLRDMGILPWLEAKVAEGRLEHLGFSFHDDYDYFTGIVDAYDNWAFSQVHFNYMDVDYQAGRRGIEYAADKGLGVIIMEPLRGGHLAQKPPAEVAPVWESAPVKRSPVEWALRWIWSYPGVSLILSGMSTMEQVTENVVIAERAGNSWLNGQELALIDQAREAYKDLCPVPCTGCRYCMPCPSGVEIPTIFRIYNEMAMYKDARMARLRYSGMFWGVKPEQNAANCTECGKCSEACSQHIPISDWLKTVHQELVS